MTRSAATAPQEGPVPQK